VVLIGSGAYCSRPLDSGATEGRPFLILCASMETLVLRHKSSNARTRKPMVVESGRREIESRNEIIGCEAIAAILVKISAYNFEVLTGNYFDEDISASS
jgi:hypothetical protein